MDISSALSEEVENFLVANGHGATALQEASKLDIRIMFAKNGEKWTISHSVSGLPPLGNEYRQSKLQLIKLLLRYSEINTAARQIAVQSNAEFSAQVPFTKGQRMGSGSLKVKCTISDDADDIGFEDLTEMSPAPEKYTRNTVHYKVQPNGTLKQTIIYMTANNQLLGTAEIMYKNVE